MSSTALSIDEKAAIEAALVDPAELAGEIAEPEAAGIISHVTVWRNAVIIDMSSFKPWFTDQYRVRLALFNRDGARIYLSNFVDKGGANAYQTLLHTFRVSDPGHRARRALVLWRAVNDGRYAYDYNDC